MTKQFNDWNNMIHLSMLRPSIRSFGSKVINDHPGILMYAPVPLITVALELTNACNLRCKMCYSQNPRDFTPRRRGMMKWGTFAEVMEQIGQIPTVENIGLNLGGESLLHKNFIEMLEYVASKRRYNVGFHSNGMLLTDEVSEAVVRYADKITLSLDGCKNKNESIRVGANYDTIGANILNLLHLRGSRKKPAVAVNCVTSDHTLQDIEDFKKEWKPLVDEVLIYPEFDEYGRVIPHEYFGEDYFGGLSWCQMLFTYLAVLWNGDVTPCCRDIGGNHTIGNIHTERLIDIFHSPKLRDMRRDFLNRENEPGTMCHTCNSWNVRIVKEVSDV